MALERVGVHAVVEGVGAYQTGANQVTAANQKMAGSVTAAAKQSLSFSNQISSVTGSMVRMTAGLTAMAGAAMVVKSGLGLASMLEQAQVGFTTMLGSEELAKKYLDDLYKFAAKTPFQMAGLVSATQQLLAMGFAAEDVIPMLTTIGDTAAGLGAGQFGIDRITRALGQMRAKGKVSAEEMRQLAEMGIPAWEMLADAIGVDIPKAMKMSEQGAIQASEAIPQILAGMNARFGGLMEKQATSMQGLWSTFMDTFQMASANVMKPLLPAIKDLIMAGTGLLEVFQTVGAAIGTIGVAIGPVASILSQAAGGVVALTKYLKENKEILIALSIVVGTYLTVKLIALTIEVYNIAKAFGIARVAAVTFQASLGPLGIGLAIASSIAALVAFNFMAKKSAEEQQKLIAASKEWAAEQKKTLQEEAQTYHLDEMAHSAEGLAKQYDELTAVQARYANDLARLQDLPTIGPKSALEAAEAIAATTKKYEEQGSKVADLKTEIDSLKVPMEVVDKLVKEQYISLQLANELWPKYKEYVGSAAQANDQASSAIDDLNTVFKTQIDNLTLLSSQLREYDSALNQLAGTETAEEVALRAASEALDAQIKYREAQIALGTPLTQTQQDELKGWEDQKTALDAMRDALQAQKDAQVASIQAQAQGRPTMQGVTRDIDTAGGVYADFTGKLNDSVKAYQAASWASVVLNNTMVALQNTVDRFTSDPFIAQLQKMINYAYAAGASVAQIQGMILQQYEKLPQTIAQDTGDYYQNLDENLRESENDFRSIKKTVEEARAAAAQVPPVFGDGNYGGSIAGAADTAKEAVKSLFDLIKERADLAVGALGDIRNAFSDLFSRPTKEEAQINARLAQLKLQRARLVAAGAKEPEVTPARREETEYPPGTIFIGGIPHSGGVTQIKRAMDEQLKAINNEIDSVQATLDLRQAEQEVLRTSLDLADQTLISDTQQMWIAQVLIGRMGNLSQAVDPVIDLYYSQAQAMATWREALISLLGLTGIAPADQSWLTPAASLQHGGIVPGSAGEPQLILAHGKEVVFNPAVGWASLPPLLGSGIAAPNYAINVNATGSTAEEVRRLAHQAIDEAFNRARSVSYRSGSPLSSGIG